MVTNWEFYFCKITEDDDWEFYFCKITDDDWEYFFVQ